jgi:hypothetical protein
MELVMLVTKTMIMMVLPMKKKLLEEQIQDPDSDGDGKDDFIEGLEDIDGDGIIDALDSEIFDTDGDGLNDEYDIGNEDYYSDSDGDGYKDWEEVEDMARTGRPDIVNPLDSYSISANGFRSRLLM